MRSERFGLIFKGWGALGLQGVLGFLGPSPLPAFREPWKTLGRSRVFAPGRSCCVGGWGVGVGRLGPKNQENRKNRNLFLDYLPDLTYLAKVFRARPSLENHP